MTPDKIFVLIFGISAIGFIYWYFLHKEEKETKVTTSEVTIEVNGGYSPNVIAIPNDKTTKIHFIRKDKTACLEEVVLGDFKIRKYLPLNQKITVELTPHQVGEFGYSCGMGMFHGKIIVKDSEQS